MRARTRTPRWMVAVLLTLASGCAVTTQELRLAGYNATPALSETEASSSRDALEKRVDGLWTDLGRQKLTTYLTKTRITPYFETEKDLTEFIAIYASLMRNNRFARESVLKYRVNEVKIEPNGVVARVDVEIWGRIYFLWYAKIHEVQRWQLSSGKWYMKPEAY